MNSVILFWLGIAVGFLTITYLMRRRPPTDASRPPTPRPSNESPTKPGLPGVRARPPPGCSRLARDNSAVGR